MAATMSGRRPSLTFGMHSISIARPILALYFRRSPCYDRGAVTAPYVRSANAAGSLSIGLWDHWVPDANKTSTDLINEWAEKEKVAVQIDYITSNGRKDEITIAAEAAKPCMGFSTACTPPSLPATHGLIQ